MMDEAAMCAVISANRPAPLSEDGIKEAYWALLENGCNCECDLNPFGCFHRQSDERQLEIETKLALDAYDAYLVGSTALPPGE